MTSLSLAADAHRKDEPEPVATRPATGAPIGGRELTAVVATLALTLLALTLSLQLWRANPAVPFASENDATFNQMVVQNIIDTGWYEHAPRLGAPFGASLYDFPQGGDNLQFVLIRGLTVFSSDAGTVTNAYFLLTFLLVAMAGYFVFRWLGVSRPVAVTLALLYDFLPYHFFRGETHLFLSGYFGVPLGVALAVTAARGAALFDRRPGRRGLGALAGRRTLVTLLLATVVGSSGSYYAAFVVIMLAAAGGLQALRNRSLRASLPAAAAALCVAGVLGLNLLPNAIYWSRHDANPEVAQRSPAENERYGLKITSLLLPSTDHRVGPLGSLSRTYRGTSDVPSEDGQYLGAIGALGFLWLLVAALGSVAGARAPAGMTGTHRTLAFLSIVSVLTATVGGFSVLVAFFVTPQFRSWNRFGVVLGFLALAAIGLLLDGWWADRTRAARAAVTGPSSWRRTTGTALLGVLLIAGLLDQTTAAAVPSYRSAEAHHDSNRAFVAAIEQRLPEGAMVYQLPFVPFPEAAPVAGTGSYDQVAGYLLSHHLRWSYGGMRGREHDWQRALGNQPTDLFLARLAAVGFRGLWIDRDGYADRAAALEADVANRLAAAPLVSIDQRYSFFLLKEFAEALGRAHPAAALEDLAAQTLAPVQFGPGVGMARRRPDGATTWFDGSEAAELTVVNPGTAPRTVVLDSEVGSIGPGTLKVTWPDGTVDDLAVAAGQTPLDRRLVVPTGASTIRFRAGTPLLSANPTGIDVRFRLQPALYDAPPPGF